MKTTIKYSLTKNFVNINKDKLSNQLSILVDVISKCQTNDKVSRDDIYIKWLEELSIEENDKVFASYIHQLIQFDFLDRIETQPKKVVTIEDRKKMFMKQLSLMSKEDRDQMLNSLKD